MFVSMQGLGNSLATALWKLHTAVYFVGTKGNKSFQDRLWVCSHCACLHITPHSFCTCSCDGTWSSCYALQGYCPTSAHTVGLKPTPYCWLQLVCGHNRAVLLRWPLHHVVLTSFSLTVAVLKYCSRCWWPAVMKQLYCLG